MRALLLPLLATLAAADVPQSTTVIETLAPVHGSIVLTPAEGSGEPLVARFEGRKSVRVTAKAGSTWMAQMNDANVWIARSSITFPPAAAETTVHLRTWPAAVIRGRLRAVDPKPEQLELTIESAPLPGGTPAIERQHVSDCRLLDDGAWSCRVPATKLDVSIRAGGYVPHYVWGAEPAAERPLDVGEIPLRRGGSVAAWLTSSAASAKDVQARLSRVAAPVASQVTARLAQTVASARPGPRGFIQLAPVPAGEYVLEVAAPGFAPTRVWPIKVYEGKESSLRKAIELQLPLTIRLSATPPLDPYGKPWRLRLDRASEFGAARDPFRTVEASFALTGNAAIEQQTPGRYELTILDSLGNSVQHESLTITGAADADRHLSIASHALRGRVTAGGEPLRAQLSFGGRDGAVRVRATSSEEGEFTVVLPKRGAWRVHVSAKEAGINTIVSTRVADEQSELHLEVPNGVVAGKVTRGDTPVANADVLLLLPEPVTLRADERGEFRAAGMPEGVVRAQARERQSGETSQEEVLTLREDEVRDDVVLELRPRRTAKGRVLSEGRPVVGAAVRTLSVETPDISSAMAVTDLDGRFSFDLPNAARTAIFNVMPGTKAFTAIALPLGEDELLLNVSDASGTVIIEAPPETRFTLLQNGVQTVVPDVMRWALGHGETIRPDGTYRLPRLAPGTYRACRTSKPKPVCAEGVLAPHATVKLDLR